VTLSTSGMFLQLRQQIAPSRNGGGCELTMSAITPQPDRASTSRSASLATRPCSCKVYRACARSLETLRSRRCAESTPCAPPQIVGPITNLIFLLFLIDRVKFGRRNSLIFGAIGELSSTIAPAAAAASS
jgi:hypothetical protein